MRNLISITKKCELAQKEESKELKVKKNAELMKEDKEGHKEKLIEKVFESNKKLKQD